MKYLIALDIGTSSTRAVLYAADGRLEFSASREYHCVYPQSGYVEQDPLDWTEAAGYVLRETALFMRQKGYSAEGIAVTSQRASMIPLDDAGRPLRSAVMWQDKRTLGVCRELEKTYGLEYFYQRTGLRINPVFVLPKLIWLKANEPEIFHRASRFVGVQDYVTYYLTGEFKTDWTQASRTMLLNLSSFTWEKELLDMAGITEDRLCTLVPPGSIAGGLLADISEATGLPAGLPVVISGGDQQNAAMALGVVRPGAAEANTGTGSFVLSYSDKPVFDSDCRVLCQASAMAGKWMVEAGIFNTGSIYRWFKELFCPDLKGTKSPYMLMDQEAASSPTGSHGVVMLPHFEGSFAPNWNPSAKGVFFNLSLGITRADMLRSILEGIAMEICDNINLIQSLTGPVLSVSVAGGMARSDLFCQIQASAYDRSVVRYENNEASSLGACMVASPALRVYDTLEEAFHAMACKGYDTINPCPEDTQSYIKLANRRKKLYQTLNEGGAYAAFLGAP